MRDASLVKKKIFITVNSAMCVTYKNLKKNSIANIAKNALILNKNFIVTLVIFVLAKNILNSIKIAKYKELRDVLHAKNR